LVAGGRVNSHSDSLKLINTGLSTLNLRAMQGDVAFAASIINIKN
jgi:hypothetical protein